MTAQALALHLDRPRTELRVVHNPENPEAPLDRDRDSGRSASRAGGRSIGRRGAHCPAGCPRVRRGTARLSLPPLQFLFPAGRAILPELRNLKQLVPGMTGSGNLFRDLVGGILELTVSPGGNPKNPSERLDFGTGPKRSSLTNAPGSRSKCSTDGRSSAGRTLQKESPRKVLVKLDRNTFLMATGASERALRRCSARPVRRPSAARHASLRACRPRGDSRSARGRALRR